MDNYTIRRATKADSDAVLNIACRCWEIIYDGYRQILGDELYAQIYNQPLEAKMRDIIQEMLEDRTFVAELDGVICGFASYRIDGTTGVVGHNAVLPEYKGRGIAGRLYEYVFEQFRAHGCTLATVLTGLDDGHAPARRAYQKMGFEVGLPSIRYYKKL